MDMARPLRIQYEGAWYHVMNRGLSRQLIYKCDEHRNIFLELLAEIHQRFGVQIHAYCLMGNHYHLLLHTPKSNLSRAMRHLDGVYTQKFNKKVGRDGALFRGRYKSILIDEDNYLLQVNRYIHLNPVAAGLVITAQDYRWSSYQLYIGKKTVPSWLYCNHVLSQFGENRTLENYIKFINEGNDCDILALFSKKNLPSILGDKSFIEKIKRDKAVNIIQHHEIPDSKKFNLISTMDELLKILANFLEIDLLSLKKRGNRYSPNMMRNFIIYLASSYCQFTHQEIAATMGHIHYSAIGKLKKRMHLLITSNPAYQKEFEKIKQIILPVSNAKI
jgi:putative transposase